MNLIEQLQQTPKWKEFKDWYNNQLYTLSLNGYTTTKYELGFVDLPFEFKKGVFEKFIESRGYNIEKQLHDISYQKRSEMSDEEILSKRFNECWFIRTVFLVGVYYQTHTLNPNDYTENSVPFDSFEELLIWYFNN